MQGRLKTGLWVGSSLVNRLRLGNFINSGWVGVVASQVEVGSSRVAATLPAHQSLLYQQLHNYFTLTYLASSNLAIATPATL